MAASVYKVNGTGATALATSMTVPAGYVYELVSVTLNLNAAPTTDEAFTVTLNAAAGVAYDTLLYSVDLSDDAATALVWTPDVELLLWAGDAIDVAWNNTEGRTYGVQITMRRV